MQQSDSITAQEIFAQVWQRFVMERAPRGTDSRGWCSYRGMAGTSCAVGCLLTDDEAQVCIRGELNGCSVDTLHEQRVLPDRFVPHVALLGRLQSKHDNSRFSDVDCRAEMLREVAADFGLTVPGEVAQ